MVFLRIVATCQAKRVMPPSRDALGLAIGKVLFLKLSKEDVSALLKDAGVAPEWAVIAHYTRQAVKSVEAARTRMHSACWVLAPPASFGRPHALLLVALSWVLLGFFGGLPYLLDGCLNVELLFLSPRPD